MCVYKVRLCVRGNEAAVWGVFAVTRLYCFPPLLKDLCSPHFQCKGSRKEKKVQTVQGRFWPKTDLFCGFFPSRGCSAVELKEEVEEFNEDIRSLMASPFNFLFGELCGRCNRLLSIFSILPMASSNNVEYSIPNPIFVFYVSGSFSYDSVCRLSSMVDWKICII